MLKLPTIALVTVLGLVISKAQTVRAVVLNGSFETGDFSEWITTGQATVEDSLFGTAPTDGTYQSVLETLQDITAVCASEIETFLGISAGSLTDIGVTEGSAIKQTITANAGDMLTFYSNFLTDQDPPDQAFNDFAFFSLSSLTIIADTNSATNFSFTTRLVKETGYQLYSYKITTAGTYTLGFGVVDVGDTTVNSALLVDKVTLSTSPISVPEPTTTLSILALGAFGVSSRLLRRQNQRR